MGFGDRIERPLKFVNGERGRRRREREGERDGVKEIGRAHV